MGLYIRTISILLSVAVIGASANYYLLEVGKPQDQISFTSNKNQEDLENKGVIYRSNGYQEGTSILESELTHKIKQALAKNPNTAVLNLNVSTVGPRVTISGKAENTEQIKSAIDIVLDTPGVGEVISTVVVDPDIQIAGKGSLL
ncbi:MAG: BON domain-containing protein [Candidatus Melainabacteria bacterium]|nr:BON domain-containing protein [Candidatus Melainabacteria bacterium]MBI3308408.1 BON domain-containing protein [Candidatus Melainabacteria bacterium]